MPLLVYLDETGDHSLEHIHPQFPIFALAFVICRPESYAERIVPSVYRFKIHYFGHECVVLHSRDIRKQAGPFAILTDAEVRSRFYADLNRLVEACDFHLLVAAIHKHAHAERYGWRARNPYDMALGLGLGRLVTLMEEMGEEAVTLVAESRGRILDAELELAFRDIVRDGTDEVGPERFARLGIRLVFAPKSMDVVGTQIADLAAYPFARRLLNPEQPNPALDVLLPKLIGFEVLS